jgi:hypothetical protein
VILKIVPKPSLNGLCPEVVPYRLPSVPCTSAASGPAPSVPSKLCNVVKVCAGSAIAVVAHHPDTMHARRTRLILPSVLTIRFIDAPLLHTNFNFSPRQPRPVYTHPPIPAVLGLRRRGHSNVVRAPAGRASAIGCPIANTDALGCAGEVNCRGLAYPIPCNQESKATRSFSSWRRAISAQLPELSIFR